MSYTQSPAVVRLLLIANGIMFLMEMVIGQSLVEQLALWPPGTSSGFGFGYQQPHFQVYQLVSYAFLHGGLMHLLLNMYALWLFGSRMESLWGSQVFTVYYFVCVLGAGLTQLLVATLSGGSYPTVGASGGVFGLLLAFGVTFPRERLLLIFPPMVVEARWFVLLFGGIELFAGVTGTMAGVAHFAHLGGMLFGYLLILYWRAHPPRFR